LAIAQVNVDVVWLCFLVASGERRGRRLTSYSRGQAKRKGWRSSFARRNRQPSSPQGVVPMVLVSISGTYGWCNQHHPWLPGVFGPSPSRGWGLGTPFLFGCAVAVI